MSSPPGIVVVGGGFAGFWAAMAARRVAGSALPVTVVSREPVLAMRPRLYEADPHLLSVPLPPLLARAGVSFVQGEAAGLDMRTAAVHLANGEDLAYDRLILATGSVLRVPPLPDVSAAHSIDTLQDAVVFDQHLAQLATGGGTPVVVVVGAGFSGIELTLELRDRLARHGAPANGDHARIVLVDQSPVVGPELGPEPRPAIEAALVAARVELLLPATLTEIGQGWLRFANGDMLQADAVVLTTGSQAAGFTKAVPGQRDALGRVRVDQFLRAVSAPGVYVTGDAAAADAGDGQLALQSCQHALQMGRYAGENAARDLLGLQPVPYVQPPYVTCLDLGRSGAVFTRGRDRSPDQTGIDAKALKRKINTQVIYPPAQASREELVGLSALDPAHQAPAR